LFEVNHLKNDDILCDTLPCALEEFGTMDSNEHISIVYKRDCYFKFSYTEKL